MDERSPLLKHDATDANRDLTMVTVSGCETSLQKSDVDELQSLLNKAQTVLKNQAEDSAA